MMALLKRESGDATRSGGAAMLALLFVFASSRSFPSASGPISIFWRASDRRSVDPATLLASLLFASNELCTRTDRGTARSTSLVMQDGSRLGGTWLAGASPLDSHGLPLVLAAPLLNRCS